MINNLISLQSSINKNVFDSVNLKFCQTKIKEQMNYLKEMYSFVFPFTLLKK